METIDTSPKARLASLDQLLETVVAVYIAPPPSRDTLRNWLDAADVPRFKSNPLATRGGGPVYYSVSATEKMLRNRTMPRRVTSSLP